MTLSLPSVPITSAFGLVLFRQHLRLSRRPLPRLATLAACLDLLKEAFPHGWLRVVARLVDGTLRLCRGLLCGHLLFRLLLRLRLWCCLLYVHPFLFHVFIWHRFYSSPFHAV